MPGCCRHSPWPDRLGAVCGSYVQCRDQSVAFWTVPIFFVADLQFWLYRYGHTLDGSAPLDTGAFTPKVLGTTKVWNFHSDTGFEIGFYLMVAAALVITFGPPALRMIASRSGRPAATKIGQPADLTANQCRRFSSGGTVLVAADALSAIAANMLRPRYGA